MAKPLTPETQAQLASRLLGAPTGTLPSWSHSKLGEFQKCRYRTWLLHVAKVPEPERPLPPGRTEHANDRGSRIHDAAEKYVRGMLDALPTELHRFSDEFAHLRALYEPIAKRENIKARLLGERFSEVHLSRPGDPVELEGEWGFDSSWVIAPWRSAWVRMKLDAMVFANKHSAVVIDYKSGRKDGNEVKHGEQLQMYQLAAFMRYPELEEVIAELWYLDTGDLTSKRFTRDQGLRFLRKFTERGNEITSCTEWPANPNRFSCQWCHYKQSKGGPCTVGV